MQLFNSSPETLTTGGEMVKRMTLALLVLLSAGSLSYANDTCPDGWHYDTAKQQCVKDDFSQCDPIEEQCIIDWDIQDPDKSIPARDIWFPTPEELRKIFD